MSTIFGNFPNFSCEKKKYKITNKQMIHNFDSNNIIPFYSNSNINYLLNRKNMNSDKFDIKNNIENNIENNIFRRSR